jgi:hypothetical protein
MDLQRRDEYKQKLFDLTPEDGKSIGNAALHEKLRSAIPTDEITQDDYWDLRNSLIADGKLEKGRGHGGSVRRVLAVSEPAPSTPSVAAPAPIISPSEASLYKHFQKSVLSGYVPDNDLKPFISEVTALQGRRATGGRWTRPDITLIAIQTFTYVPNKLFEVITFEIKPDIESALDGVFEATARCCLRSPQLPCISRLG